MPLFYQDTNYQLRLMAGVDEAFDNFELTDEDVKNMLEEMRDKIARRKPLAD
jgi:hypothetical protein